MTKEIRTFKLHNNIIHTIFYQQAGSFVKALLELYMNSVDAGASRIDIIYDIKTNSFTFKDDGKGFTSEQEIIDFFETLGTPHKEGDAKFGRFRLGRCQVMAYASTMWRSGPFCMHVDLKSSGENGFSYQFEQNLPFEKGCTISGVLYDETYKDQKRNFLFEHFLEQAIDELINQYVSQPLLSIYVNNELKARAASELECSKETENAYYFLDEKSALSFYNMGAYVCTIHACETGIGGKVITKSPLLVNFARNEIIKHKCPLYKQIISELSGYVRERRTTKKRLTPSEKSYYFSKFLQCEIDYEEIRELKIFTDVHEKEFSLKDFSKASVVSYSDGTLGKLGEMVNDSRKALVFNKAVFEICDKKDFSEIISDIWEALYRYTEIFDRKSASFRAIVEDFNASRGQKYKDLSFFKESFSTRHKIFQTDELKEKERVLLQALKRMNDALYKKISHNKIGKKRQIFFGESAASSGWTDGVTYIAFSKELAPYADKGAPGFDYLMKIMIHEYIHTNESISEHPHNAEFHKKFHDILFQVIDKEKGVGCSSVASNASKTYAGLLTAANLSHSIIIAQENAYKRIKNRMDHALFFTFHFQKYHYKDAPAPKTLMQEIEECFHPMHRYENNVAHFYYTKGYFLSLITKDSVDFMELFGLINGKIDLFIEHMITSYWKIGPSAFETFENNAQKYCRLFLETFASYGDQPLIANYIEKERTMPLSIRKAIDLLQSNPTRHFRDEDQNPLLARFIILEKNEKALAQEHSASDFSFSCNIETLLEHYNTRKHYHDLEVEWYVTRGDNYLVPDYLENARREVNQLPYSNYIVTEEELNQVLSQIEEPLKNHVKIVRTEDDSQSTNCDDFVDPGW